jgi:hypothetical protein
MAESYGSGPDHDVMEAHYRIAASRARHASAPLKHSVVCPVIDANERSMRSVQDAQPVGSTRPGRGDDRRPRRLQQRAGERSARRSIAVGDARWINTADGAALAVERFTQ